MTYRLFIFGPQAREVLFTAEGETPFPVFGRGDFINVGGMPGATDRLAELARRLGFQHGVVLRVEGVEHYLAQVESDRLCSHTLHVFTSAFHNVRASRPVGAAYDLASAVEDLEANRPGGRRNLKLPGPIG